MNNPRFRYIFASLLVFFVTMCLQASSLAGESLRMIRKQLHAPDSVVSQLLVPIDSVLASRGEISSLTAISMVYDLMVKLHQERRYNDAVTVGMTAADEFAKRTRFGKDENLCYIHLLIQYGSCCQTMGLQSKQIDSYLRALNIAQNEKLDKEQGAILGNLGSVYLNLKELDRAEEMFAQAIAINKRINNSEGLFVNYNNMSVLNIGKEDGEKALEYAYMALHQLNSSTDVERKLIMQRNIATLYSRMGMKSHAIAMIRGIAQHQLDEKQQRHLVDSYRLLGSLYLDVDNTDSARYFLRRAINLVPDVSKNANNIEVYRIYAQACSSAGDNVEAYKYASLYSTIQDSIQNIDKKSRINSLVALFEDQRKQNVAMSQLVEEKSQLVMWIAIVGSIVIISLIVGIIVVRLWYLKNKKRLLKRVRAMRRKDHTVMNSLEEHMGQMESHHRMEYNKLLMRNVDDMRDHEFVEHTAAELRVLLRSLSVKNDDAKKSIRAILSSITQYESHNGIDEFNSTFERLHPTFFDNLTRQFGTLTPKELRLCALIRLGLSTKSIADITFREPRSVESARNRLRKKFNLSQDENLTAFLLKY